jgi:hypothetical protein
LTYFIRELYDVGFLLGRLEPALALPAHLLHTVKVEGEIGRGAMASKEGCCLDK